MNELPYALPKPCNLGKKAVSDLAEKIAEQVEFNPSVDLESLVSRLGGQIHYKDIWDLHSSESGSIEINSETNFHITLASHTSKARDRFTIAHELGHYFLHYRYPKLQGEEIIRLRAARSGNDLAEIEANWFAASFLMPEAPFREAYQHANGDLEQLSQQFAVSMSAASVRVKSLRL
jgi:Zn-dependent peptidase ImmA (M78 family)